MMTGSVAINKYATGVHHRYEYYIDNMDTNTNTLTQDLQNIKNILLL